MNPLFTPSVTTRIKHIHLVGIGGTGMCGIAELLHNQGYIISGSDIESSSATDRLKKLGIKVFLHHEKKHIEGVDMLIKSAAIATDNVEITGAHERKIPVVERAEVLADLMREKYGIAVAGTHGKTTTTCLIASVLAAMGHAPTFIAGGLLNQAGTHAALGDSAYLVVEADESDGTFMHLHPRLTVVTNVDHDHLDVYGGDYSKLTATFVEFLHNLPIDGLAVLCADDPGTVYLAKHVHRFYKTYGFTDGADYQITQVQQTADYMVFDLVTPTGKKLSKLRLNMPGKHYVLNAAAAAVVAMEEDASEAQLRQGLLAFQGVKRRFEIHGKFFWHDREIMLVEDYGHHPTELRATFNAAKSGWPDRRLVVAYQPHRYTRTRDVFHSFVEVLSSLEVLVLMDIYAAGEAPIAGIDANNLLQAIQQHGSGEYHLAGDTTDSYKKLQNVVKNGDIVLVQGAGNVGDMVKLFLAEVEPLIELKKSACG